MTTDQLHDVVGVSPLSEALSGARCPTCAVLTYPAALTCPRCGDELEPYELPRRGSLWSWTVQRFAPKSPPFLPHDDEFVPFVVGYVELDGGIRVEAIIEVPPSEVWIGMALVLSSGSGVPRASLAVTER